MKSLCFSPVLERENEKKNSVSMCEDECGGWVMNQPLNYSKNRFFHFISGFEPVAEMSEQREPHMVWN